MKLSRFFSLLFIAASLISIGQLSSCKNDDEDEQPKANQASFTLEFKHVFGSTQEAFNLNQQYIHPTTGDTLIFTKFKYYISNIRLQKNDGSWWSETESYHLIDYGTDDSHKLTIKNVPIGEYKAIYFVHGVDSARNFSGAQEGALAISNNMFWGWNSGYIMMKLEGNSPQATNGNFAYHLGGFADSVNIVTPKTADFGSTPLKIQDGKNPRVIMAINPARAWHTLGSMTGITNAAHMPGPLTTTMAKDIFGWTTLSEVIQ